MGRLAHERSVGVRLLERDGEIAQLDALLEAAAGGAGRTALVEAAAGLGKSRLLEELRTRASDRGFRVLRARGSELEREFSFGIVRQLFGGELADGPAARIVAAGEEPTLAAKGADEAFRSLHALYWLVAEAATSHGPLLLTIDDLHWADEPSLRWLSFLGRRIDELRLLVVTAHRASGPTDESPLVAGIASDPATFVLRLRPLRESAVAQLVRATLAPDADDAFCSSCHYATGGNPLFLGHLLDALGEEGVRPDSAGAERVAEVGPRSVLRSVRVRLSALGEEAVRVAESVAVLGDDADLDHAGLLARLEPSSAPRLVAALIEAEILRSASRTRLSFVHPIVRAAVYEGISPIDRELAHVRAADVLRQVGAEPERVAAQLLRTEPRGDERSVTILRQAAREARVRGAPDGAARLLERALAEPPLPALEGELLYELGSALRSVSAPDAVARLSEAIDALGDGVLRGHAAFELGQTAFFLGDQGPVAEVLMRESDRLAETESDLSRRLEAIVLGIMIEDPALYVLAADRLERLRKEQPSEGLGARMVMGVLAYHDARAGRAPAQAVRWARRALEERAWEEWPLGFNSGLVLAAADELDEADALYGRILDASRERGSILSYALASCFRGEIAFDRGDLSRAGADLWQAVEAVEQSGFAGGVPTAHALLARVMVEQGDADGAAAVLERVGAGPLDTVHRTSLLLTRAITRLARGDIRGGVDDLLAVGRRAESLGIRNPAMGGWRWAAAEGLLALGDRAEARRLAREDLDLARAWKAPSALGRALRIAGLAEGGRDGMDLLVEAAGVLERSPNRLEEAKALVELGAALRRANRRSDSREPLQRGLELADRAGARPVAERAHAELLATGARPRRIARSGLAALTPSERRVSELAAQGMTNKEIAHSLFVTLRTVEVHLTAAYRKLDIESRTQLSAALSGHDDA